MSYYHSRTTSLSFDEAVVRTREALKAEHFGVITEIDVAETFKQKLPNGPSDPEPRPPARTGRP